MTSLDLGWVQQARLLLTEFHLPLPLVCYDYRCAPSHLAHLKIFHDRTLVKKKTLWFENVPKDPVSEVLISNAT